MLRYTPAKASLFLFGEEEKGLSIKKKINMNVLTMKAGVSLAHSYVMQRTDLITKIFQQILKQPLERWMGWIWKKSENLPKLLKSGACPLAWHRLKLAKP